MAILSSKAFSYLPANQTVLQPMIDLSPSPSQGVQHCSAELKAKRKFSANDRSIPFQVFVFFLPAR